MKINNIQEPKAKFGKISRYDRGKYSMLNKKGEKERLNNTIKRRYKTSAQLGRFFYAFNLKKNRLKSLIL